jgi:hypothetical protein
MKLSMAQCRRRLAKLYRNAGRNHVDAMRRLNRAAADFATAHKYKAKIECEFGADFSTISSMSALALEQSSKDSSKDFLERRLANIR